MTRAIVTVIAALILALGAGAAAWAAPNDGGPGGFQQCQQDCGPDEPDPPDDGPGGFQQCEQDCGPDDPEDPDPADPDTEDPDPADPDGGNGGGGASSSHGGDVVVARPTFTG